MREHRGRERLHVVGQRVVAPLERGERLGGLSSIRPARGLAPSSVRASLRVRSSSATT